MSGLPLLVVAALVLQVPIKLTSLSDLQKLPSDEPARTRTLLSWLVHEQASPSTPTRGLGGMIDSGYIQGQIIFSLKATDARTLSWLCDSKSLRNSNARDALVLALGLMGDVRHQKDLERIVRSDMHPSLRTWAVRGLGFCSDDAVLKQALKDQTRVEVFEGVGNMGERAYPVRQAAKVALRIRSLPEGQKSFEATRQRFRTAMMGYEGYVRENARELNGLLALLNRPPR